MNLRTVLAEEAAEMLTKLPLPMREITGYLLLVLGLLVTIVTAERSDENTAKFVSPGQREMGRFLMTWDDEASSASY